MEEKTFENPFDLVEYYFQKEIETKNPKYRQILKNKILNYLQITDDGSYTFKPPAGDDLTETMHTSAGAISESFEKFVNPLKIPFSTCSDLDENDKKYKIAILDICSGFGYNAAAMLERFSTFQNFNDNNSNSNSNNNSNNNNNNNNNKDNNIIIHLDLLEFSTEILKMALVIPSPIKSHKIIKKAIELKLLKENLIGLSLEKTAIPENILINIYIDDARKTLQKMPKNYYNGVFLDAFSPKIAPELYSLEFFKELRKIIKKNGHFLTYTSSIPVKSALVEAGFHISKGPIFGRKTAGTSASPSKELMDDSLSFDEERLIALSDLGIPFRDPDLNLDSDIIFKNRKKEREIVRSKTKISSAVKSPIYINKDIDDESLKRRVLRNLAPFYINSLDSPIALELVRSQNINININDKFEDFSRYRILDMKNRLEFLVEFIKTFEKNNIGNKNIDFYNIYKNYKII